MKKLVFIVGATYFATRHWDNMPEGDKTKFKDKAKTLGYKAAQFIGRELEEIDYRMAWRKLGR